MKFLVCLFVILGLKVIQAQSTLVKDIDGDRINDSIYIDQNRIICKLSTQSYSSLMSGEVMQESMSGSFPISATKNGFDYSIILRRAGSKAQFRYNPTIKNVELIGLSRYEFGNAANDGSGESSINLLTNRYIGNWSFYDITKERLIKIPTIDIGMVLPKIKFNEFTDAYIDIFSENCSEQYYRAKAHYMTTKLEEGDYNKYLTKNEDDIDFNNVSISSIPKFIEYDGNPKNLISWNDIAGKHFVLTTETGIHQSPRFSHDVDEGADAELFAYHYLKNNDSQKRLWKVYDFIEACPVEIEASFIKNTLHITDLDNNGTKEIWLMYRKVCHGDVSPLEMKIIMYEGSQKFAMRGHNKVQISDDTFYGGAYKFDQRFSNGPTIFKEFAKKMWSEHLVHNWEE
ncbi:hypothetical protein GCM10022393_14160 [Aquimarina addita]|uniref:Uncharacterized protein n=1 Tax=Aquimarina addita TaxID=870485 RepID=A0ABP7XHQ0_9FLAO